MVDDVCGAEVMRSENSRMDLRARIETQAFPVSSYVDERIEIAHKSEPSSRSQCMSILDSSQSMSS